MNWSNEELTILLKYLPDSRNWVITP